MRKVRPALIVTETYQILQALFQAPHSSHQVSHRRQRHQGLVHQNQASLHRHPLQV